MIETNVLLYLTMRHGIAAAVNSNIFKSQDRIVNEEVKAYADNSKAIRRRHPRRNLQRLQR